MPRALLPEAVRAPTLFDACTSMAGWADQFGTGTRRTEAAVYLDRPCLRMTGLDSTLQVNRTLATSLALQPDAEAVYVLWSCSDVVSAETGTQMRCYIYPETSSGSNSPDLTNFIFGGMSCAGQLPNQWNLSCIPLSLLTTSGTGSVTDLRTKRVSRIGVRATVLSGTKPDFYIGGIWVGGATRTKVMLGYDGNYISQKTLAKPAHDLYGIPGTLFVAKHTLDSGANFLTSADLDTFYAAGWDICGHSWNFAIGWENLSTQQILDEIGSFRAWAKTRGYVRGDGHWAWPYSVASDNADAAIRARVAAAVQQSGLTSIRVGSAGSGLTFVRPPARALGIAGETGVGTVFSPQLTAALSVANWRAFLATPTLARLPVMLYAHEIAVNQAATVSGSATNFFTPANYDQTATPGATQSLMPWLASLRSSGLVDLTTPSAFWGSFAAKTVGAVRAVR
jgi:hypothetical protein